MQREITTAYVSTYSTSDSMSDISHVVSQLFDGHWTKGNSSLGAAAGGSIVGSALLMPTHRKDPPNDFYCPRQDQKVECRHLKEHLLRDRKLKVATFHSLEAPIHPPPTIALHACDMQNTGPIDAVIP